MKRFFSKSVFISLFAAMVILTVVLTVNSMKKHITIVIDGKEQVVQTFKDTVDEVLQENNISVAKKDKVDRNTTDVLAKEDKIEIVRAVQVELIADGALQSYLTPEKTVRAFFEAENVQLYEKDKLSVDIDAAIVSGMKMSIDRAVPVEITADGATTTYLTPEKTVKAFFETENIVLNEKDKLSLSVDDAIQSGMKMTIVRVTSEIIEEKESIAFAVQEKKDSTLLRGKSVVKQEGTQGEKKITKEVTYEDGVEVARVELSTEVVKAPVDKIVAVGTKVPPAPKPAVQTAKKPSSSSIVASRGGSVPSNLNYSKSFRVEATAYALDGITATGTKPVRVEGGWSTIAVDPRVIPLGTKVYIENYGYAVAEDTGGAIKGNKIDVYMNSNSAALSWGRRTVTIYILN
ncbi:ubiquitin-like domain-containing protein [Proteiniclasticum sp.]|uniref:ubiquitin-like domain-containing protein n=1 Tax=Proteiniclasticum sp. TaxID=2053595 RepID=UPI0028A23CEC|nr:ubiquitin-like domain-containing protein [Proteiniclasticum sp.]